MRILFEIIMTLIAASVFTAAAILFKDGPLTSLEAILAVACSGVYRVLEGLGCRLFYCEVESAD